MKKTLIAMAMLALGFTSAQAAFSPIKVNNETISKTELEQLALQAIQNNDPHKIIDPDFESGIEDMAIEHTVLSQEAKRQGLDKDKNVQGIINDNIENILAEKYRQKEWMKNPVTGFDLDKAYAKFRKDYGDTEVQFKAIIVDTQAKADEVLANLKKGANFAKEVAAKTLDKSKAGTGGLYNWQSLELLPPDLRDALKTAKKGDVINKVIKTPQGYIVAQLEDTRPAENIPPFAKMKDMLRAEIDRERNKAIIENLIKKTHAEIKSTEDITHLAANEARKLGYDQLEDVKANIENMKHFVLSQVLTAKVMKTYNVSEAELKKQYDEAKAHYGTSEVRMRTIVVKTEKDAQKIIDRLKKGEDFSKIAQQESSDPSTKDVGGLLDWMSINRFTTPIRTALQGMKKGDVFPKPVQSSAGWHVIRLEDQRAPQNFPTFEESKERTLNLVKMRKYKDYVATKIGASDIVKEGGQSKAK